MLTLFYGLLLPVSVYAECGCMNKSSKPHQKRSEQPMHEVVVTVNHTIRCKGHQNLHGKKANAFVGMLLHNAGMKDDIYISGSKISTEKGTTKIISHVPEKYKEEKIETKIKEGFENLCKEEEAYEKQPVEQRKEGSCWVCHKLTDFKKWWQSRRTEAYKADPKKS